MSEEDALQKVLDQLARFEAQAWRLAPDAAAKVRAVLGAQIEALGGTVPAGGPGDAPAPASDGPPPPQDAPVLETVVELENLELAPLSAEVDDEGGFDFDLGATPQQPLPARQEDGHTPNYDVDNPRFEDLSLYELQPAADPDPGMDLHLDDIPAAASDAGEPKLVVRVGTDDEEVMTLSEDDELSLGRGKDCGVRLKDARASRVHCRVFHADGGWQVEDLGSANGTMVNGEHLPPRSPRPLAGGEELLVGSTVVRFELGAPV